MTRQDITNVRVKVKDLTVIRNREDAVSIDMFVNELQKEPYNPILLYKRQHDSNPSYSSLRLSYLPCRQSFRRIAINSMLPRFYVWMLPVVPMPMDSN